MWSDSGQGSMVRYCLWAFWKGEWHLAPTFCPSSFLFLHTVSMMTDALEPKKWHPECKPHAKESETEIKVTGVLKMSGTTKPTLLCQVLFFISYWIWISYCLLLNLIQAHSLNKKLCKSKELIWESYNKPILTAQTPALAPIWTSMEGV